MFTDREPLQFLHTLPLQTALAKYSGMANHKEDIYLGLFNYLAGACWLEGFQYSYKPICIADICSVND